MDIVPTPAQQEGALVAALAADMEAMGFRCFAEVSARWEGWRREKKVIGRIDLVAVAPRAWPWWERFRVLAIEAKDTPSTGERLTNMMQATSAMDALELWLHHEGETRHLARPSIALYCDRDTLRPRDPTDTVPEAILQGERLLWRAGCGVLRRCAYKGLYFVAHQHDLHQKRCYLSDRGAP